MEILKENPNIREKLNFNNGYIQYLSANRIGVRDLYTTSHHKINKFGILGEYAIDYFEKNQNKNVEKYLIKEKSDKSTLGYEVNYWFRYVLNSEMITEKVSNTDSTKVKFKYINNRPVRTKNIGSGLSYIISILIVCLASKKDDVIIIENPEIHLHPKAQSKLTEFFTFIANAGIQLIIETHSDHIFNGIRVAVNKKIISTDKISINFFDLDRESLLTKHTEIKLNELGRILNQQEGLFDQFDDDVKELLGLKKFINNKKEI